MTDLDALIAGNRRWVRLHRENKFQREAASRMARVLDELEAAEARRAEVAKDRDYMVINAEGLSRSGERLKAERDAALAVIEEAREAIGEVNEWDGHGRADQLDNTRRALASVPADVLRERDAEKVYLHRHTHRWRETGTHEWPGGTVSPVFRCMICGDAIACEAKTESPVSEEKR